MTDEENKVVKKSKSILVFRILTLAFLAPALLGFFATLDTYALYQQNADGNAFGMAIVLIFCVFLWYMPCNTVSLIFSILGTVKSVKYYKRSGESKGKLLDYIWFLSILCIGAFTFTFGLYIIIRFTN